MASDPLVLLDDFGDQIEIETDEFEAHLPDGSSSPAGAVLIAIRVGKLLVRARLSGERLAAFREAVDRASMPGQVPLVAEADPADPFGGHEFAYESSTDLFRCTRCRRYEVTVREGEQVTPCEGDMPGEPMELNAY